MCLSCGINMNEYCRPFSASLIEQTMNCCNRDMFVLDYVLVTVCAIDRSQRVSDIHRRKTKGGMQTPKTSDYANERKVHPSS